MDNSRFWKEMYETSNDLHKLDVKCLKQDLEEALTLLRNGMAYRTPEWYESVHALLESHNVEFDRYD